MEIATASEIPDLSLLSTGDAARFLGTSRQHVVDLCDSGRLPCVRVGTHRRVDPLALKAFLLSPSTRQGLRREQLASLWLHHAVAGHLVRNPEAVLERAWRNLDRLSRRHPSARPWLDAWRRTLDNGPAATLQMLTSTSESAVELRQNSPFAGVLTEAERRNVLESFRTYGKGDSAA
jgi:excisionase family DNA binding protein